MKVFLHIGAGKTGTSAIQVALAQSRMSLLDAGVCYPEVPEGSDDRALRGEISSGNARALGWLCNPNIVGRGFTREDVLGWIERSIRSAGGRNLVFSSETMQSARPEEAAGMLRVFQDAGYAPQVIFYVRHVLDHAIAEYLQHVKMGFATMMQRDRVECLEDFLRQHRCRFLRSLRPFAAVLPKEALHVRLYDAERERLVPGFFDTIGAGSVPVRTTATEVVNRSPTPSELPLFEGLARLEDGTRLCRALSGMLLNAPARTDRAFSITPEDFDGFRRRNQPVIDEINAEWLQGADKLALASSRIRIGPAEPVPLVDMAARFAEITAIALRTTIRQRSEGDRRPQRDAGPHRAMHAQRRVRGER